jgi:UPF0042 nucleotide-binding protein
LSPRHFEIKVVSGLSGSGKSTVLRALEDRGYFCIDNLPAALLVPFADLCDERADVPRIAIGIDVRSQKFWEGVEQALVEFDRRLYDVEVIFLDASDEVLMRRFSETRRPHPLARYGDVLTGISEERKVTAGLRERADMVLDSSHMDVHELRRQVGMDWVSRHGAEPRRMRVRIQSFGFKHGLPIDSDLVFDARFLPNPYFVEALRPLSGEDRAVRQYVLSMPESEEFLEEVSALLGRLIPRYEQEGKTYLTISIGCTGGRHRSVAVAAALASMLDMEPAPEVIHRDKDRDANNQP